MSERLGLSSSNYGEIELDPSILERGVKIKLTWMSKPGPHSQLYTVGGRIIDENGEHRIVLSNKGHDVPSDFTMSIYEDLGRNGFDDIEVVETT